MLKIIRTPQGHACLNLGCGNAYRNTWTNVDLKAKAGVQALDLRKRLPVPDGAFDAVYSSHVLEHLTEEDGLRLLHEICRVLKPGGVCRVAVPDLEEICRQYLNTLEQAVEDPTETKLQRYRWMRLELMDQMVRQQSGGKMRVALENKDYDPAFLKARMADQFEHYWSKVGTMSTVRSKQSLLKHLKDFLMPPKPPQKSGEAHLWMYDRLSLKIAFEKSGFELPTKCAWDESQIPNWSEENLDSSRHGDGPRKPDSIYFEGRKPT